jgi:hypothetical protein
MEGADDQEGTKEGNSDAGSIVGDKLEAERGGALERSVGADVALTLSNGNGAAVLNNSDVGACVGVVSEEFDGIGVGKTNFGAGTGIKPSVVGLCLAVAVTAINANTNDDEMEIIFWLVVDFVRRMIVTLVGLPLFLRHHLTRNMDGFQLARTKNQSRSITVHYKL